MKAADERNSESAEWNRSHIIKIFLILAVSENDTRKSATYDIFSIFFCITHMRGVPNRSCAYVDNINKGMMGAATTPTYRWT